MLVGLARIVGIFLDWFRMCTSTLELWLVVSDLRLDYFNTMTVDLLDASNISGCPLLQARDIIFEEAIWALNRVCVGEVFHY